MKKTNNLKSELDFQAPSRLDRLAEQQQEGPDDRGPDDRGPAA